MEEGGGPIVKLTRLRRRLSVEAEDVKSPSTPSTPTKKRGGRLAAKPQLELIDEHAGENVPKRTTRKSMARDIIDAVEEKPVTPSRRSARIRSNTSIVSDTPQNFDSPRAKRAARRISQAGSDNEGPSTPARQTRRTRKDSTSSLDKGDAVVSNKISPVTDVIVEEVENTVKENKDSDSSNSETPTRRSPRLNKNKARSGSSKLNETVENEIKTLNTSNNKNELKPLEANTTPNKLNLTTPLPVESDQTETPKAKIDEKPNLSITSYNLIEQLDTEPKKTDKRFINKSLSSVEVNNLKDKRHRTKSWSTITKSSSSDGNFYSDTEISKKKNRTKNKSFCLSNTSGDGILNTETEHTIKKLEEIATNTPNKSNESIKIVGTAINITTSEKSDSCKSTLETPNKLNHSIESKKENIEMLNSKESNEIEASKILFDEAPSGQIQSLVYIEDSDSNTDSIGKPSTQKVSDEDQCVPVIEHQIVNHEAAPSTQNNTCEPMDIDETMPENISIPGFQNKTLNTGNKSSSSIQPENETSSNKSNESLRKSLSISQNLDKSGNENKSTLILSQIKDLSSNELMSKSTKVTINGDTNTAKLPETDIDLKPQSQNYSTSTPLQQKPNKKLGLPLNTSLISPHESKQVKEVKNISQNKNSSAKAENSDSSEDNMDSDEESIEKLELVDDEAKEASDDYESGDSRDEDERQYEEENEIKEKGETLDSDDDISNDTDYEKDSFIVSSDEEDNELLSGSGDDLSLSDNELTMSAKSKNKFNKRKEKEQKKASKEMYEARHKINDIDSSANSETPKTKKNNRMRLDSTLLDSDNEDINVSQKKNTRRRIDSSQDISSKSEADKSVSRIKKRTKRLSESMGNESLMNEKEITLNNESILDKNDPLSIQLKQEPKTPQKDLSAVLITDGEEVEEVNVNENDITATKMNETSDPLHATMAIDDDSSSSSDNAEIIQNYDSMLNDLNNDVIKKREKLWDTSLNLTKKTKSKSNAPIVDQLNLTLTKTSKKKAKSCEDVVHSGVTDTQDVPSITTTKSEAIINIDDGSSDSIDLRLLFPEDSDDSEIAFKNKDKPTEDIDEFIPLKRTVATTDMTEKLDTTIEPKEESFLNISKKKDKKRKSRQPEEMELNETTTEPKEDSFLNVSKKDKKRKSSVCPPEQIEANIEKSEHLEVSVLNVSKKKEKKRKSVCPPEETILSNPDDVSEPNEELILNVSQKSKKRNSISPQDEIPSIDEEPPFIGFYVDTTGTGFDTVPVVEESTKKSVKNKKNKNKNNSMTTVTDSEAVVCEEVAPLEISYQSEKKKKSKQVLDISQTMEINAAEIENTTGNTPQNKKKKSKQSLDSSQIIEDLHTDIADNVPAVPTSRKDKKKNKKASETAQSDLEVEVNEEKVDDIISHKEEEQISTKKRKRKSSGEPTTEGDMANATKSLNESLTVVNQKKKRKITNNDEVTTSETRDAFDTNVQEVIIAQEDTSDKITKNKHLSDQENVNHSAAPVNEPSKKSRKRKERDNDAGRKVSKIFKENSFDKVHVPRLPANILNQLDDKPKAVLGMKKSNPVSTTQFIVEETKKKKSKPSNYLEESVYLNESPIAKKQKVSLKKPKVLPFIPTASTSGSGYTTNFRVNQIPKETQFVAQSSDVSNFKNEYLQKKKIKKFGTYELYKKGRNIKLSKF